MNGERGMIRPHAQRVSAMQRVVDALGIALAHLLASLVYPNSFGRRELLAIVLAVLVFNFVAEANNLYRPWRGAPVRAELTKLFWVWAMVVPTLLFAAFAVKESATYSRAITTLWFVLTPIVLGGYRLAVRAALRNLRKRGYNTRTVAILGGTDTGASLARRILGSPWSGFRVIGWYDDDCCCQANRSGAVPMPSELGDASGGADDLVAHARQGLVDVVYVALPMREEARIKEVVRELADTTASVYLCADFFMFDLMQAQWSNVNGMPVVSVFESPFLGVEGWLKRAEDIVLGTLALLVSAVPMLVVAVGVKLTSRGPIFFRQRRYGLGGDEILVWKFRSMRVAENGPKIVQAQKEDPRITPFGRFIRRTSLDELPQLFNVLGGSMSLVGPRPHAVAHNEQYRRLIRGYMLRHKVKPGITGWAQVNGWRGETDTLEKMQKRIEHDLHYIENWDLFLDIKILWLTVFGTKTRTNAY